jgi:hypothetical protein
MDNRDPRTRPRLTASGARTPKPRAATEPARLDRRTRRDPGCPHPPVRPGPCLRPAVYPHRGRGGLPAVRATAANERTRGSRHGILGDRIQSIEDPPETLHVAEQLGASTVRERAGRLDTLARGGSLRSQLAEQIRRLPCLSCRVLRHGCQSQETVIPKRGRPGSGGSKETPGDRRAGHAALRNNPESLGGAYRNGDLPLVVACARLEEEVVLRSSRRRSGPRGAGIRPARDSTSCLDGARLEAVEALTSDEATPMVT